MFDNAIEVIKIIEEKGFKAYIVGGYVRDMYLSRISTDIDICTSAEPKDLLEIFGDTEIDEKYGSVKLKYNNYYFDITTFRKDFIYDDNRRPSQIEYVDSLEEDLIRRDFTINTMCIDINKNIIDILDAKKDIDNKIIRTIRDASETIKEDSLRILRAIRFATALDFKIDSELEKAIKENVFLLNNLSFNRKKAELDLIFSSTNYKYGINLIEKYGLCKELEISNLNNLKRTSNILGMWAQINFSDNYPFTKVEKETIKKVRELILYGKIDSYVLYRYGIDLCIILCEILDIDKEYIIDLNNNLKIQSEEDIDITILEISKLLDVKLSNKTKDIIRDIEYKIINGELDNDRKKLEQYIITNYGGDKDEK